jgi:hypothetical protein
VPLGAPSQRRDAGVLALQLLCAGVWPPVWALRRNRFEARLLLVVITIEAAQGDALQESVKRVLEEILVT